MAGIPELTLDSFEPEALMASLPVLVYYFAPWCRPCRDLTEDLGAVAGQVAGHLKVVGVNTDRQGEIARRQRVRTLPTFQLIQSGKVVTTIQGSPSRQELLSRLGAFVADSSKGDENQP